MALTQGVTWARAGMQRKFSMTPQSSPDFTRLLGRVLGRRRVGPACTPSTASSTFTGSSSTLR